MQRLLRFSLALVIAVAFTGLTFVEKTKAATVYYVALDGNDANPGTESQPWRTIQHAAETLQAGDTVHIKAGEYRERVYPRQSGTAENPITYMAHPGDEGKAVLDGTGIRFSGGGLFSIRDKAYLKVSHLRVENSDDTAIYVNRSNHIVIEDNTTKESHSSGIGVWSSSNIIVAHNTVINARNVPIDQGGHEECISIANTDTFEVRDNEVYYDDPSKSFFGGAGIDVKESSSNGKVYRNYVHDIPHDGGIYLDGWNARNHDQRVFQNFIRDAGGISIGSERGGTAENIWMYNNVVVRSRWAGILIDTGEGEGGIGLKRNISIFNNTIYGAKGNGGAGIYVIEEDIENILIENNIVSFGWGTYGSNGWESGWVGQITAGSANILSKIRAEKNLIFGPEKCSNTFPQCKQIPNGLKADPQFRDRLKEDFHLMSTSPAIDLGVDLRASGVTDDFEGVSRPQGSAFDLGAFEFVDNSSTTIFADVPVTHPYYEEIEALYRAGYTAGCATNPLRYCPDRAMSRAESAVFVERGVHGADVQPGQPSSQTFADLPLGSWAAKWAVALYAEGYTAGCGADPLVYCPWQGHTRAEGAVFYLRMLHGVDYIPPDPQGIFADVPVGWWGAKWAEEAYGAGLIPACEEAPLRFCPDDPLTRGLAAFMMVQAKGPDMFKP